MKGFLMKKLCFSFVLVLVLVIGVSVHAKQTSLAQAKTPEEIVYKFCTLDSEGARLSSDKYSLVKNLTTWEDEAGWDEYIIIKNFKILSSVINEHQAEVKVTYHVLGTKTSEAFKKETKTEKVTYLLKKINDQWKIESPQLPPHALK